MNNKVEEILEQKIKETEQGRNIWIELTEKYKWGKDEFIIMMPSLKKEYNYTSLLYLEQFLKEAKAKGAFILTFDESVLKTAKLFSDKIKEVIYLSRPNMELIMQYYCLRKFSPYLFIASLEEPKIRNGWQLIGKKGITIDTMIATGIYRLKKFYKPDVPDYLGDDNEIKSFLEG